MQEPSHAEVLHMTVYVRMNQFSDGPDSARKCYMYSNVSYAQLSQPVNGIMYTATVLVLCNVSMVTTTVYNVINCHRTVQVANYSIPYLFCQVCIIKYVCSHQLLW